MEDVRTVVPVRSQAAGNHKRRIFQPRSSSQVWSTLPGSSSGRNTGAVR